MASRKLGGIEEGGLLVPSDIETALEATTSSGSGSFVMAGSLLDYMIDESPPVLDFELTPDGIEYEFDIEWPSTFPDEKRAEVHNRIRDAFLRSGVASHPNLDQVMEELRGQDDVIIGVDGNILEDCIMTSTLLDEIYAETYPNWILVGIPRLVMSEIESTAKEEFTEGSHPRVGWPTYDSRVGQRALQEVMDLREKNPDRPGLAMMTIGELQRESFEAKQDEWRIDALIRDQFKEFLDNIGFHKGTFFLSQNRVNVMMSGTEGSDSLYLQKPELAGLRQGRISVTDFTQLLYELCVQFGSITIEDREQEDVLLELSIYWPGKQISDWAQNRLNAVSVYN